MDKDKQINKILEEYNTDNVLKISKAFGDGGAENPTMRLARAAGNQAFEDPASFSRYGIWANTVRDNICKAKKIIDDGDLEEGRRLLTRAANSLSAFSDIQALFDTVLHENGKPRF